LSLEISVIEARLKERDAAIRSETLDENQLRELLAESLILARHLHELRGRLAPQLSQISALLSQLRAAGEERLPDLDLHA
jgi:hypothetical protein